MKPENTSRIFKNHKHDFGDTNVAGFARCYKCTAVFVDGEMYESTMHVPNFIERIQKK